MAKISPSRKNTNSIMNHQRFGDLTIRRGNQVLIIPQNMINTDGTLKTKAIKLIASMENKQVVENTTVYYKQNA